MADLFAGGAVGIPFTILYEIMKEVVVKCAMFKPLILELNAEIQDLKQLIDEMTKLNKQLDLPEMELSEFKLQMIKAPELLRKCCDAFRWNPYKWYKYSNQLIDLKGSLKALIHILQVQQARDVKAGLVVMNNVQTVVGRVDDNIDKVKDDVKGMKVTIEEVKGILVQAVQQIDNKKGELQNQIDCEIPGLPPVTVGLYGPLRELKMKLLWDEKVSMLVLSAPGGYGKTTLATMFCQDEEVKDIFKDNIFFVTVSKKSSFNLIVQGLYQRKSADVPSFENERTAIKWLHKLLKEEGQNRVLLVLDDVWSETISILERFDEVKSPNFKILVTSRTQFAYGSLYHLSTLSEEDAMILFRHSASLGDGPLNIHAKKIHYQPELSFCDSYSHITKFGTIPLPIAASCNGYPLVIDVVGKSLRGKALEIWHKKASEWSKGETINDFETDLLLRLRSSLDCLDGKEAILKECFIDLGSFPQGHRIPAAALIDMWAELYEGLGEDYLAVANLHDLADRSLADVVVTRKETAGDDGYYSEHFVTQHDMLRQLAVYQAKLDKSKKKMFIGHGGDNLPKCLTQQTDDPIKPDLLSVSSDETFTKELHNIELAVVEVLVLNFNTKNYALPNFVVKMRNLKVLILTNLGSNHDETFTKELHNIELAVVEVLVLNFNTKNYALPNFVVKMRNLKVLILTNLGSNHGFSPTELSNFHLLASLPQLKTISLERISIPSVTKIPIRLESLKKISLFMCSIGQAFSNVSFQISDAFPNLEEMNIDYCNNLVQLPDGFCNLVGLKKLSITNCHRLSALPEEIGELEKLETLRVKSCSDLVILPCSIQNLMSLKLLDICGCFSIKELPENIGELSALTKINMRQCSRLKELPMSVRDLENKLEEVICDEDTLGLWEPFFYMLPNVTLRVVQEKFDLNWL